MKKIIVLLICSVFFLTALNFVFAGCGDSPDFACEAPAENCETCPIDCICTGDTVCQSGSCVPFNPAASPCDYQYYTSNSCLGQCPSGYACTEMTNSDCTYPECNQDICWCNICTTYNTGIYFCGIPIYSSNTCNYRLADDTDCDGSPNWILYPLRTCTATNGVCNLYTNSYCDTAANPNQCCRIGWYWNGAACEEQAHCNDICPWEPTDGQYWFDSDCIFGGATECCCVTGNYGDPDFKEYLDIVVY